ncbi:hypothetical protein RCL1_003060 [Eukaryota sp. TZLM3-RCL]
MRLLGPSSTSLSLSSFDILGFDLDHCLVQYHHEPLCDLCYSALVQHLVNHFHLSNTLLQTKFNHELCKRGSVLDFHTGNLLFVGRDFSVVKSYHGFEPVIVDELFSATKLLTTDRFLAIPTFFERAVSCVFATLVDYVEEKILNLQDLEEQIPQYSQFFSGKFSAIGYLLKNSMDFNFSKFDSGYYYCEFEKNPLKYVKKTPEVGAWLRQLSPKLVLITNSLIPYANLLLKECLDVDPSVFTQRFYAANKPLFWINDKSRHDLIDLVESQSTMLYFGDHPVSDVARPSKEVIDLNSKQLLIKTVAIIEEDIFSNVNSSSSNVSSEMPCWSSLFWIDYVFQHAEFACQSLTSLARICEEGQELVIDSYSV